MTSAPPESEVRSGSVFADPPPPIPRFNWGAFFIPPIWGIANGQWPGIFFLPLWVFIDNLLRGPQPFGAWSVAAGVTVAGVTLGAQAVYALNANRLAWHRAAGRTSPERFARHQRLWGMAGLLTFAGMAVWITLFVLSRGGS